MDHSSECSWVRVGCSLEDLASWWESLGIIVYNDSVRKALVSRPTPCSRELSIRRDLVGGVGVHNLGFNLALGSCFDSEASLSLSVA